MVFFLAPFLIAQNRSQQVSFSVTLREWLVLEVRTPSKILYSKGNSRVSVSSELKMDNNPVDIRVLLCVPRNQEVHLRVQALGDLRDYKGRTYPISKVGWKSRGEGFRDGKLEKNSPQIMGMWKGPGYHEGTVNYYYFQDPEEGEDYSQTLIYSLIMP